MTELVGHLERIGKEDDCIRSDKKLERFVDWIPPPKKDVKLEKYTLSSLPGGVQATHHWEFRLFDARRKHMEARDDKFLLTGICVRSNPVWGLRTAGITRWHPRLVDPSKPKTPAVAVAASSSDVPVEAVAEDVDTEEEDDAVENADIGLNTKEFNGWRCSYAEDDKGFTDPARWRLGLKKLHKSVEPFLDKMSEVGRRRTLGEKLKTEAKHVATDKTKKKIVAEAFKDHRAR